MQARRKAGVLLRVEMPAQDGVDERAHHAREGEWLVRRGIIRQRHVLPGRMQYAPTAGAQQADTLVLSSGERDAHGAARPNHVYPIGPLPRPVDAAEQQ
jgi:hypothetical protein